jgi:hypothetical protein
MAATDQAHYSGPSPTGKYYYTNLATGDINESDTPPTPTQQAAWESDNPGYGTTGQTQATPAMLAPTTTIGGTPVYTQDQVNQSLAVQDDAAVAPSNPGVGAGTTGDSFTSTGADDNSNSAVGTKNATATSIDNIYGAGSITPQPNILDQYSSYTYQASVYLMSLSSFQQMVASGQKTLNGSQLLFQSGGAPIAGRNPYFSNDYYIDKVELKSTMAGKGSGAAHNVNTIKMTVIEPNGITLLSNLDKAVQQYLGTGNAKQNFASQIYLLVIRFFGYDQNGNLVQAGQSNGITNTIGNAVGGAGQLIASSGTAFVEKYYPMAISKINFRVANKLVEYEIEATAAQYQIGFGQSRGTIPYNVELSGLTTKDILSGVSSVNSSGSSSSTSRVSSLAQANAQDAARDQEGSSNPLPAPSNATAAPTAKSTVRKGLMEALNQYQKDWVDKKIYTVADVYSLEFTDSSLESATVTVADIDFKNTSLQAAQSAKDKLDPSTQAVDPNSRIITVTAGQQIVQVIDQVVRNSKYIKDQQTTVIDESTQQQKANGTPGKNVAWFKISTQVTPIKWDPKRNDYAYNVKYIVSPYRITQTNSNYFTQPQFNGVHKQYNYWFTGQNTEVLSYEQTYNALYTYVLSGGNTDPAKTNDQAKYNAQPRSGQSSQGGDLKTNEPSANLADSLYNPADLGTANLTIVGDPAWLQQGEASFQAPGKNSFVSSPFLADGTINFDSQQVLFEIIINTPTDYNINTGLMDVNNRNVSYQNSTQPQSTNQSYVYIANECISEFNKGKFTQQLKGTLVPRTITNQTASGNGRVGGTSLPGISNSLAGSSDTRNTTIPQDQADAQDMENGGDNSGTGTSSTDTSGSDVAEPPPSPQPAAEPGDPTSTGDIAAIQSVQDNYSTGGGGFTSPADAAAAVAAANPPQLIAQDDA